MTESDMLCIVIEFRRGPNGPIVQRLIQRAGVAPFTEAEQQKVREILLRYCDPKLDGMTAL